MKKIKYFTNFVTERKIFESIKTAKDILLKRYAQEKGIKTLDVSPEDTNKMFSSPLFTFIRDLTIDNPGYAPLFTYFVYDQKIPRDRAKKIMNLLKEYKGYLKELELNNIDDYGKIPYKEGEQPGWERLETELENMGMKSRMRSIYQDFRPSIKKEFAKAPKEEIKKLESIINSMYSLKDKEGKDLDGNTIQRNAINEFIGGQKKYIDTRTYPGFADPRVAFLAMIKDAEEKVKTWELKIDEYLHNIEKLGPQAKIIYYHNGYLAIAARTNLAVRAVAGNTTWCIREPDTFSVYTSGRVQYCVLNTNLPDYDPLSLVGITVNPDLTVHDSANSQNVPMHFSYLDTQSYGTDFIKFMEKAGWPNDMITDLVKSTKTEVNIGRLMSMVFGGQGAKNPVKALTRFLLESPESLELTEKDKGLMILISEIIENIVKDSPIALIKPFMDQGLVSKISLDVFKKIIVPYCDKSSFEIIKGETINNIEDAEATEDFDSSLIPQSVLAMARETLSAKDELLKYIEQENPFI
jgi:hypothetical protein